MNIKKILCSHKDIYVYRKYNDFDFVEYQKCKDCNKVLNTLEGFDEDLRGQMTNTNITNINIQILLVIWCLGAAIAAIALLIPIYTIFLVIGSIGWMSVGITTILIFYNLKK